MLALSLVLLLSSSVFSESVRETETWMPMKSRQTGSLSLHGGGLEASGDGSDFGFVDDDEDDYDDEDDDDYEEFSGSGDEATQPPAEASRPSAEPDANDNRIPELERPAKPSASDLDRVRSNQIPGLRDEPDPGDEFPSNVLMAHAANDSIFNKTEVLAALIAGGAVGLMFAVLLVLLLVYRMKKKDEGSYDLGRKPIYKKAPTTEIYA